MLKEDMDYAVGLETPYWIQRVEIKGKVFWTFQTPVSFPFLFVFALTFLLVLALIMPFLPFLTWLPALPVGMCVIIPWRVGKLYVEKEYDGKKVHYFILGAVRFFKDFILDQRCIHNEQRRKMPVEKIVFEKTNL
ncbi:conjugal transfer protein [Lactococcus ileimucosae]|uniref:conjugal transfer protein n=1 Tax=Lactococcus ileimucosae TaxID=2941329 RepID=UPI0019220A43|nr:conjugal transfer protein [Lactococcus ileimucosae]MBL3717238.1 conjugal transfer protein [Lactococcus garvieae]